MKSAKVLLGVALIFGLVLVARAADQDKGGKEKTLRGELVCAKCTLKEATKCTNALKVKEGDKVVVYILDDNGKGERYHGPICPPGAARACEVTGVVSEKDGQKIIKPKPNGVKFITSGQKSED